MGEPIKASECKCCVCGKPAVAFWPLIDPDIPEHPYCRRCLDKAKIGVLIQSFAFSEKQAKDFVKMNNTALYKNKQELSS